MTRSLAEDPQHTVQAPVSIEGVGLFSGVSVTASIHPAEPNAGIVFRRVDLEGKPTIPARVEHVSPRPRRTALKIGDAVVETIEHCMSALAGLGVDNARIDLDGPELPAGDGSASSFVEAITRVGLIAQDDARHPLVVTEPITVRDGESSISALPIDSPRFEALCMLDYGPGSAIGQQVHAFAMPSYPTHPTSTSSHADDDSAGDADNGFDAGYINEIAPARTFSMLAEARAMRERGLFAHLSPQEMLVIGDAGPIDNRFRFENEPVRHKVLDLIGDLALVGRPIHGRIVAVRPGHALNHDMARALIEAAQRNEQGAGTLTAPAMDTRSILRLLPHRYPMVLVDRVLEIEGDRRAVGIKNVTINEPFFQGHYPGTPIMPGVLIVEAMCQLGGLMLSQKLERTGKVAVLLSLDNVKLRKGVTPGDQLVIETETMRTSTKFGDVQARAFVDGALVAEARVKFLMVDAEQHL